MCSVRQARASAAVLLCAGISVLRLHEGPSDRLPILTARSSSHGPGRGPAEPDELEPPAPVTEEATLIGSNFSVECPDVGTQRAVFLSITGLRERLLLNSTLKQVVRTLVTDGFAVHVYMSLVDKKKTGNGWLAWRKLSSEPAWLVNVSRTEVHSRLAGAVRAAGGCLAYCSIYNVSEALPKIKKSPDTEKWLWQYSPLNTDAGKNLLRFWQAKQKLWRQANVVEERLGKKYSLAIWVRDDAAWVNRLLDVRPLLALPESHKTLWSKSCKTWGGINDKCVLVGRQAASVMYSMYDEYMRHVQVPEANNAEKYMMLVAKHHNLTRLLLTHEQVPVGDALYLGPHEPTPYCFLRGYWCGGENMSSFGSEATECERRFPKEAIEIRKHPPPMRSR